MAFGDLYGGTVDGDIIFDMGELNAEVGNDGCLVLLWHVLGPERVWRRECEHRGHSGIRP